MPGADLSVAIKCHWRRHRRPGPLLKGQMGEVEGTRRMQMPISNYKPVSEATLHALTICNSTFFLTVLFVDTWAHHVIALWSISSSIKPFSYLLCLPCCLPRCQILGPSKSSSNIHPILCTQYPVSVLCGASSTTEYTCGVDRCGHS